MVLVVVGVAAAAFVNLVFIAVTSEALAVAFVVSAVLYVVAPFAVVRDIATRRSVDQEVVLQAAVDLLTRGTSEPATRFAAALERVAMAKALLMLRRPDDAFLLLDTDRTAVQPYRAPAVLGRVLAALAAEQTHRDTAALQEITDAIDQAQSIGMTGPFVTAGQLVCGR